MQSTKNNNFEEKRKEEFLQLVRRQNILWDLIDAKMVEEETEAKPYKGRKKNNPKIELQTS
jgi:hypothetical protein